MAFVNPIKPSGLSPVQFLSGTKYTGQAHMYSIPASDATYNYFQGDLVSAIGGGGSTAADVNGIPSVVMTTAGVAACGVIVAIGTIPQGGPYINPNDLSKTYAPKVKTQAYYVLVADDPNIIFEVQEGGTGTNFTSNATQRNANIILGAASTAAAPTGIYISQTQMDNTAAAAVTATLNLKIVRFAQRIDNHFVTTPSTGGQGQKWWVMINNHQYRAGILSN